MFKVLSVMGGLAGAATLSQYPEFTQQYMQRLAGQVDALTVVVNDFEVSAMRSGLTRSQAFAQMTGTPFLADRQADMRRTFARHAVLSDNLAELRAASPIQWLSMPQRLSDPETFANTWADFQPAAPLSVAGFVAAGFGGLVGWSLAAALLALIGRSLRRSKTAVPVVSMHRKEPALRKAPAIDPQGCHTEPLVGRR
ncbi:MAG: DUF2937 family protein [Yoonia sp.]|nr:DUF2937 family protein [Yoonia sp.]